MTEPTVAEQLEALGVDPVVVVLAISLAGRLPISVEVPDAPSAIRRGSAAPRPREASSRAPRPKRKG